MLADTNINTNNTNDRGTHLTQSPWNPVRFISHERPDACFHGRMPHQSDACFSTPATTKGGVAKRVLCRRASAPVGTRVACCQWCARTLRPRVLLSGVAGLRPLPHPA